MFDDPTLEQAVSLMEERIPEGMEAANLIARREAILEHMSYNRLTWEEYYTLYDELGDIAWKLEQL